MLEVDASQAQIALTGVSGATIYELSGPAWSCAEQREAECLAVRACEAYAKFGTPVGRGGAVAVRLDNVRNRYLCIVRANQYLVRLRIVDERVVAIASVKIANLP